MRIIMVPLLLLSLIGHTWGATFKGKVIDADTKQPIEGAVVVASWSEERATPAGPTTRLKDVKETLTDINGGWLIEGPMGGDVGNIKAIFSFLTGTYFTNPPVFIVFKPGYCSWPAGFMIDACKGKIRPEGQDKVAEGMTVELLKLTNKEDRKLALPSPMRKNSDPSVYPKQGAFIRLINQERAYLELGEYNTLKEYEK